MRNIFADFAHYTKNQSICRHSVARIKTIGIFLRRFPRPKPVDKEDTTMAGKIAALLNTLTLSDVEAMAPRDRRSFAERCRFWAHLVERTHIDSEGSGVLAELRYGYRVD